MDMNGVGGSRYGSWFRWRMHFMRRLGKNVRGCMHVGGWGMNK